MVNSVIFGVDNYNALGVLRSLGECGVKSTLIVKDSRCNVAYLSKYVRHHFRVKNDSQGYDILKSLNYDGLTFVFTNDDKSQSYLDSRLDELSDKFVVFNCNGLDITEYMNKYVILEVARSVGFNVLETIVYNKSQEIPELEYPVVTKSLSPLIGRWKGDFHICRTKDDLVKALSSIEVDEVLVQKFVDKDNEYCIDGYSIDHGNQVDYTIASTYNYNIQGYYSPYMTVADINPSLRERLDQFMKKIQYEGIFSIEFIVDKDGTFYFSEINLRNSTWSYIGSKVGRNIPYNYIVSTMTGHIVRPTTLIPNNYTAMVEPIDYQKRVVERNYSRIKWVRDLLTTNCKFYFDRKDLKPFFHMVRYNKKLR